MNSITKTELSRSSIQTVIENCFGAGSRLGKIAEMPDGHFNSVYCIELLNPSREVILKVGTSDRSLLHTYELYSMETEVKTYRLLADRTEIPIPQLFKWDFSKQILCNNYILMSKLKGTSWAKIKFQLSKSQNDAVYKELGGYCSQIHNIRGDYFGFFTGSEDLQYSSWKTAFLNMVEAILKDGLERGISFPCSNDEVYEVFLKNSSVLEEVEVPSLVCCDLWEENVFIQPKSCSYSIEGIIDFEKAFWGDPCIDFLPAVAFFSDIRKQEAFLEGYCTERGYGLQITDNVNRRLNMYRAYLCLRYIAEACRYDEDYRKAKQKAYSGQLMKCLKKISY